MKKESKLITETKEELQINFSWFWKRRFHCIVLLLLIILITIQFINEPLVKIEIKQKPKQEFTCNCNCEYPQQKEDIDWSKVKPVPFPEINYVNWTLWDNWEINSSWYNECKTCWNTNTKNPTNKNKGDKVE